MKSETKVSKKINGYGLGCVCSRHRRYIVVVHTILWLYRSTVCVCFFLAPDDFNFLQTVPRHSSIECLWCAIWKEMAKMCMAVMLFLLSHRLFKCTFLLVQSVYYSYYFSADSYSKEFPRFQFFVSLKSLRIDVSIVGCLVNSSNQGPLNVTTDYQLNLSFLNSVVVS